MLTSVLHLGKMVMNSKIEIVCWISSVSVCITSGLETCKEGAVLWLSNSRAI